MMLKMMLETMLKMMLEMMLEMVLTIVLTIILSRRRQGIIINHIDNTIVLFLKMTFTIILTMAMMTTRHELRDVAIVKSYKKINEKAQTANFSIFAMGHRRQ